MAKVIGPVLFKDNILIAGPGIIDLYSKALNFCLDLRLPDPISPSLQLLSPLLEGNDFRVRGKRYKNVIKYVHWHARIPYKAHVSEHVKDAIYGRPFKDGKLDVKRYPLINVSPVIHCRVQVMSHDLILNCIRDIT
jgi:hypothetical protein